MSSSCPFCSPGTPVLENALCYARYDAFPVSPGHLLIISRRHTASWFDLTAEEQEAMQALVRAGKSLLDSTCHPDGYNIGINCGVAAGQTIPHVHLHLIPRYAGDTPSPRGGVRGVIPEKQNY